MTREEQPSSAKRSQRHYQLWKFAKDLELDEIRLLIVKRKESLKYEKDSREIWDLKTDIKILSDTFKIKYKKRI